MSPRKVKYGKDGTKYEFSPLTKRIAGFLIKTALRFARWLNEYDDLCALHATVIIFSLSPDAVQKKLQNAKQVPDADQKQQQNDKHPIRNQKYLTRSLSRYLSDCNRDMDWLVDPDFRNPFDLLLKGDTFVVLPVDAHNDVKGKTQDNNKSQQQIGKPVRIAASMDSIIHTLFADFGSTQVKEIVDYQQYGNVKYLRKYMATKDFFICKLNATLKDVISIMKKCVGVTAVALGVTFNGKNIGHAIVIVKSAKDDRFLRIDNSDFALLTEKQVLNYENLVYEDEDGADFEPTTIKGVVPRYNSVSQSLPKEVSTQSDEETTPLQHKTKEKRKTKPSNREDIYEALGLTINRETPNEDENEGEIKNDERHEKFTFSEGTISSMTVTLHGKELTVLLSKRSKAGEEQEEKWKWSSKLREINGKNGYKCPKQEKCSNFLTPLPQLFTGEELKKFIEKKHIRCLASVYMGCKAKKKEE